MKFLTYLVPVMLACSLSACAPKIITVHEDYPAHLEANSGEARYPATTRARQYFLPPDTKAYVYEFKAALSGTGDTWRVEFGKMLEDTLNASDVQRAFGSLTPVESTSVPGDTLVFYVSNYAFEGFAAHVSLNIKLVRNGKIVFEKIYTQVGQNQGGKIATRAAIAHHTHHYGKSSKVRNYRISVQQSTRLAVEEILRQLLADLNALK